MASIVIRTRNIRWRLTPLSSEKFYPRIPRTNELRDRRHRTEIYRWDCATQTGTKDVMTKVSLVAKSDFRDFGARNRQEAVLKYKAKKLDVLTATDLAPTGWEDAVNGNFALPEFNIDWQQFIGAKKPNQSFKVYLEVTYVYFMARPQLTNTQKKAANIAPIDGIYILIGLPVEWDIKVEYGAPCNGAAKDEDSSNPRKVPPAEPLKPLFEEHEQNEEELNKPLDLPGNGWDIPEWGGGDQHEELEPDPTEFEDPVEEEPVEEPLNPFEEWLFDLYDFVDELEAFGGGAGGGNGSGN